MPISQLGVTPEEKETLSFLDYNPVKNAIEAEKSLATTLNSIFLGDQHKVSSGNENIFWTNLTSQLNYYPTWAAIKPQGIPANQDKTGLVPHSGRKYEDNLQTFEANGPIHASALITYMNTTTSLIDFSVHGVEFRLGQDLQAGNVLHYEVFQGTDNTGIHLFQQRLVLDSAWNTGDFFEYWFDHPTEEFAGNPIYVQILVEPAQDTPLSQAPLVVYASAGDVSMHYAEVRYREFTDVLIAFDGNAVEKSRPLNSKNFTIQNPTATGLAGAVQVAFGIEETASDSCTKVYANGDIEILDNICPLELTVAVRIGRTGTPQISRLLGWMEVATDGVTFSQPVDSDSIAFTFDAGDVAIHKVFTVQLGDTLPNGTKIKFMLARDESGHSSGGLIPFIPTGTLAGLNGVPSAELEINARKIKVIV